MDVLWTDAIALHIYSLIVLNFTFKRAEKMFKYYLICSVSFSVFLASVLWLQGVYSYTSLWCWITSYQLKFYLFYSFVLVTGIFIAYVQLRVSRVINKDFKTLTNKGYKKDLVHISNKVTQVLIIFLITHFFGLLNRSVEAGSGSTFAFTAILQVHGPEGVASRGLVPDFCLHGDWRLRSLFPLSRPPCAWVSRC